MSKFKTHTQKRTQPNGSNSYMKHTNIDTYTPHTKNKRSLRLKLAMGIHNYSAGFIEEAFKRRYILVHKFYLGNSIYRSGIFQRDDVYAIEPYKPIDHLYLY